MNLDYLATAYPGYRIEDRSVAIASLPSWVWILSLVLVIIPIALYLLITGAGFDLQWKWLAYTFGLLLLHEGTHAVAWKYASGLPWSSFTFGVQWKTVTPYCHSTAPMPVTAYRIGAAMPLIFTGMLPWLISFITLDTELAFAGAILISGAAGDLYILHAIRDLPADVLLQDHDTQAGCVVLWPEDKPAT